MAIIIAVLIFKFGNNFLRRWYVFLLILVYFAFIDSLVTMFGVMGRFFFYNPPLNFWRPLCNGISVWNSYPLYLDYYCFWGGFFDYWQLRIWLGESLIVEFDSPLLLPRSVEEFQWLCSTVFPTIFIFNLIIAFAIFILIWTSKAFYAHIMKRS